MTTLQQGVRALAEDLRRETTEWIRTGRGIPRYDGPWVADQLEKLLATDDARMTAPPCHDCGPGYRVGHDGCRHGAREPEVGETGVCRTCALPIWWETGEVGHRELVGWSDRITRGGDSLVCFKAVGYRHVPMGDREAAIYAAGVIAGKDAV